MRTIADITTFHTPIESWSESQKRAKYITDMLVDFLDNSGDVYTIESIDNEYYISGIYTLGTRAKIQFSIKKESKKDEFALPFLILEVDMNDSIIQKSIIEDFINTMVRFFSGTYQDAYFLDYDTTFSIYAMNAGKKYQINDLEKLDLKTKENKKNKNLLDSLFALHYTLQKQIQALQKNTVEQSKIVSVMTDTYLKDELRSANIRSDTALVALIENLLSLQKQIYIVLAYFQHQ